MDNPPLAVTGRPEPGEYSAPAQSYLDRAQGDDAPTDSASLRGLAFHIAGHELHHLDFIAGHYPTLLG